jgi:hypothetical protein
MNRLYSSIYIPVFKWLISINNIPADKYLGKKAIAYFKTAENDIPIHLSW